jgi:nitrile hydratase accessory protein
MNEEAPIDGLPLLPRDDDGPVFAEPWQASAFALAVELSAAGHFTWPEWTGTFSAEIKAAQAAGDPDLGDTYYVHWINALERLVSEKSVLGLEELRLRKEAWREAYLATPHGQPIELLNN